MKHLDYPTNDSESTDDVKSSDLQLIRPLAPERAASSFYDAREEMRSGGLIEYWHILRRRKNALLAFALVGGGIGFFVGLPQTPVYRAHTSVEVLSLNEDFLNMKQTNPVSTVDNSFETSDMQTRISLLQSESLLKRVVNKLGSTAPAFQSALPVSPAVDWRQLLHLPKRTPIESRKKALQQALSSLKVVANGKTRLVGITVDSTDPQVAADFANTLDNEFIEQNLESHWKTSQRTSDWLARQLDEMRIKLENSETALQAYAQKADLVFTDEKNNVSADKLRQVQQQLSVASADRMAKQSKYELTQSVALDSLADVLNDAGLVDTQAKLIDLRGQLADLSTTYTPEYAKIRRLKAQVAALQSDFDHDRDAIVSRIKNDYKQASRQEELLYAAYSRQTKEVVGEGQKTIQYNILKRDVDSNRQLYETMLQQLKESSIASALRASNVRVVDPAEVPQRPFAPNFMINSVLGLLCGTVLGFAFVMLSAHSDRTLQDPSDLQFWTNLPLLGVIPASTVDARRSGHPRVKANMSATEELGIGARAMRPKPVPGGADQIELVSWQHKPSLVAEAFRTVLTSVMFAGMNGGSPRMLVLTSAEASDGKTTIATNLGIAMAEIGQRVLIIDADLRRPRMHQLFDIPNDRGLTTLLRESSPGTDGLNTMLHQTSIPGLYVLPSGPSTHAAVNLLYSPKLPEVLTRCKNQFDVILIDTPPMLQMTDARVIGRLADAVVYVARAGKTTKDAALAANQRFVEDRIRVLGTILNDWNPKNSPNGYYGYYNKAYYSTVAD